MQSTECPLFFLSVIDLEQTLIVSRVWWTVFVGRSQQAVTSASDSWWCSCHYWQLRHIRLSAWSVCHLVQLVVVVKYCHQCSSDNCMMLLSVDSDICYHRHKPSVHRRWDADIIISWCFAVHCLSVIKLWHCTVIFITVVCLSKSFRQVITLFCYRISLLC